MESTEWEIKLNEPGRQKLEDQNSRQQAKHAKLYCHLLQVQKSELLIAVGSQLSRAEFLRPKCPIRSLRKEQK